MPLVSLNVREALKNTKKSSSLWPSSKNERLSPFVAPEFTPSFEVEPKDSIFCMGSCFARNLEAALIRFDMNCVTARVSNPYRTDEWGSNNFLIRYNPYSMLNELDWALNPEKKFDENNFIEMEPNRFEDPHNHTHYAYHDKETVLALRKLSQTTTEKIKDCRIFVMTLGLIEAWFDQKTQNYVNVISPKTLLKHPDRFVLHVLSHDEIMDCLEKMQQLLKTYGRKDLKILLSVSPVPLSRTFRDQDVFISNMYSKSALRCAAEAFCAKYDHIDYFPSYESITMSDRDQVWNADQRHVLEEAVRFNITRMIQKYISPSHPRYEEIQRPFVKREVQKKWFKKLLKT